MSKINLRASTAAVLLCAALPAAHAIENGAPITPFGVMDFGAGQVPPPSEYGTVGLRVASYRASKLRDNDGHVSAVKPDLAVDSVGVAFIKMTSYSLGDAKFGWGAVLPYLRTSLDLEVPTPVGSLALSGKNSAQGDLQLIPVILQWNPAPGWYANVQLQVQLPTGGYDQARLINAGTNHWTVSPVLAFTHIGASGFEVSSSIQVNFNGRNKDTDYKSGIEYLQEFALGQHVGPWTLGLGGYYQQQVSDDKAASLASGNGNRARVMALGPAVNYFDLGSGWPLVWVHAYKEFGARNRSQGTHGAIRAAWTF
ncbi:transporter [Rhizobacter sp. Root1221]|uniref:SphA family protein n=1 Tax=Rhizobacter sp. Root1221 TaxID=1736433 RepID=UPI0006FA94F6|nr:transporter [Rhizobacter sp. Root1221]KQV90485.1 hypothetical protein ASC87_27970 [Rhizobacter sp. Root1221]